MADRLEEHIMYALLKGDISHAQANEFLNDKSKARFLVRDVDETRQYRSIYYRNKETTFCWTLNKNRWGFYVGWRRVRNYEHVSGRNTGYIRNENFMAFRSKRRLKEHIDKKYLALVSKVRKAKAKRSHNDQMV